MMMNLDNLTPRQKAFKDEALSLVDGQMKQVVELIDDLPEEDAYKLLFKTLVENITDALVMLALKVDAGR